MNTYQESKNKIDEIRKEYASEGDIVFRTALQYVVDYGRGLYKEDDWVEYQLEKIDKKHDDADAEGTWLLMTRDFEKSIVNCAKELARIKSYYLLMYVQKEVWLGGPFGEPDYQRAIELLKNCLNCLISNAYETETAYMDAQAIGFNDDEIEYLGFGCMLGIEEEE